MNITNLGELEDVLCSKIEGMLVDPYLEVASEHFGVPVSEVTKEMRDRVRPLCFPSVTNKTKEKINV